MGRCPKPCLGGFFRRSPLRTPRTWLREIGEPIFWKVRILCSRVRRERPVCRSASEHSAPTVWRSRRGASRRDFRTVEASQSHHYPRRQNRHDPHNNQPTTRSTQPTLSKKPAASLSLRRHFYPYLFFAPGAGILRRFQIRPAYSSMLRSAANCPAAAMLYSDIRFQCSLFW